MCPTSPVSVTDGNGVPAADPAREAAWTVIRLAMTARRGGPAGLRAAQELDRHAGRALLAAVVEAERAVRPDTEIGRTLGVTGHAVGQRFPPTCRRRRGRRPGTAQDST